MKKNKKKPAKVAKEEKNSRRFIHPELRDFDISIDEFGEIKHTMSVDRLNKFLDERVKDKKFPAKKKIERRLESAETELRRPVRVLVAKCGLDGHDRGAKVIASALRDEGMEVIYTGLRQTPEMVVASALQEDVDAIGISILSGAHMTVFLKILKLMKKNKMNDVLLTGGGIIPDKDSQKLRKMGVGKLFSPGTPTKEIADYIRDWVKKHRRF